jgi:hypothetical protein
MHTGVDARRVAVPDLEIHPGDGLASGDIDNLVVEEQGHTDLVLGNVFANILAGNIWSILASGRWGFVW